MTKALTAKKPTSVSRSPFDSPFSSMLSRSWIDDVFGRFLSENGDSQMSELMNVAMDVSETDKAFEIEMDLPGVTAKEVEINIDNNTLTVSGRRSQESEEKDEKKKYHRIERYTGSFSRSLLLPTAINEDECAAEFKDGVLKIIVPKSENAKPRKIAIK